MHTRYDEKNDYATRAGYSALNVGASISLSERMHHVPNHMLNIYTHTFKLYGNMPEGAALHHASFHTSAFGKPHSHRSYKHGFL